MMFNFVIAMLVGLLFSTILGSLGTLVLSYYFDFGWVDYIINSIIVFVFTLINSIRYGYK